MLDCEIIFYIETCYHVSHLALVNLEDVFTTQLAVQVPYQEVKRISSCYLAMAHTF